jgi:hypothetical protein
MKRILFICSGVLLLLQAVFQLVREYLVNEDLTGMKYVFEYLFYVLTATALAGIISYYIAGRLKRNGLSRLISFALLIGLGLLFNYFRGLANL